MGEWSKSIGEKGEKVVKFIFEEILDFNSLVENYSIDCNKGEKHKIATKDKTTHGIDGLVYYVSPIEDQLLDIVIISSKYTASEYENYPKNRFKSHLEDLANTIECFQNSKLKSSINQKFSAVTKTDISGILVWLSNASDLDFDLISKLSNSSIESDLNFDKVILLDNKRVNFLYESIYRVKEVYGKDNVNFVYHNSSLNYSSLQAHTYGKVFPINYFYSDIIPLRIEKENKVSFLLYVNDTFDERNFSQILSFAKSFDHLNSVDKTIVNYKGYDSLINENTVKEILFNFPKYKLDENLFVKKFPSDFRNF
jgi:hypothetical protein